jgi:hypothetical protein
MQLVSKELRNLSDYLLQQELIHAQRAASELFEQRRNIRPTRSNERALTDLDVAVGRAEEYVRRVVVEIEKRVSLGKFNPALPKNATIVLNDRASSNARQKGSGERRERASSVEKDESVPIIVIDGGIPRAWRKGDPIY